MFDFVYKYFFALAALSLGLFASGCVRQFPEMDLSALAFLTGGSSSSSASAAGGFTLGGTVTGLTGTLVLVNSSTGDTVSVTSNGDFLFAATYASGDAYNVNVQSVSGVQTCYVNSNSGTFSASVSLTVNCFSTFTDTGNPPSVIASIPGSGATNQFTCFGSPCRARVVYTFNETLDTGVAPTLTAQVSGGTAPVAVYSFGFFATTFANDSIVVELDWAHLPENSSIQLTLASGSVQDLDPQNMAGNHVFSFTTSTGYHYRTSESGQTQCTDGTTLAACPNGVVGQDGDYVNVPNGRNFSGPDNSAFAADYVTRDNLTGLVWATCPQGFTYSTGTCSGAFSNPNWNNSLSLCASLNTANSGQGYAGMRGWRLPTLREMRTIVNYGASNPALDTGSFATDPTFGSYWTATTNSASASQAFSLDGGTGIDTPSPKGSNFGVRCVTGQGSLPNLVDNGDETVQDELSGLLWMKCSWGQSGPGCATGTALTADQDTAITNCEGHFLAGRSDWRLPGVHEYNSIMDFTRSNPPTAPLFSSLGAPYWTSSSPAATSGWFNASTGTNSSLSRIFAYNYRCVAGP